MIQIIPAILATNEEEYKIQLQKIEKSGLFEDGWVHIDLMDNKFVQNQSINMSVVSKYPIKLNVEAHLMVEYPEDWIDELVKIKINRIIFPIENQEGIEERLKHVKNHTKLVGLVLNPETALSKVEPFLEDIDVLLIMGVHPGFQGQKFVPETLGKIKEAVRIRSARNLNFRIEVDGGVSPDNTKELAEAGADCLVIGSHLLKGNIEENLEAIWEKLAA